MIDRWITDGEPSERFPYYTRANADEVGPEPFSPLGWTLGWEQGCIPGVADGFVGFGVVRRDEFRAEHPEVFGCWGGYFYNQLSLPRVMGLRMPGASPDAIDRAYFGDHPGVPPYVPDRRDEDEAQSARLGETMAWVMSTDGYPAMDEEAERARAVRAARPDLTALSDAELVAYARSMAPRIATAWKPYCEVCLGASLGPGAVQAVCSALGRDADAVRLLAGIGGVESAEASVRLWDLGRMVAASALLGAAFDAGVDGLLERLRADGGADSAAFLDAFAAVLAEFGHRGPNEWDMRAHSWETKPELALGMVDRLRRQDEARSPREAAARAAAERERLTAEVTELTTGDPETQGTLLAGLRSASIWLALRERGKNAVIRLIAEAKVALFELGERLVERGHLEDPQQLFMIRDDELDAYLADPDGWRDTVLDRDETFEILHDLEPPYIVSAAEGVPSISSWPHRGTATAYLPIAVGDVLSGAAAAPGAVEGRARIVLDPADPGDLRPDDVMVVHTTDPSWTPLFLSVGGVVCDVGAVASHAAIVSRELGVPCVVSVVGATRRIPDGARIRVDGSTGAVEVVSLP